MFGRNGAGKSTLLKIAAARLMPDTGAIHFGGRAYLRVSRSALAIAGLFYLPDDDLLSNAFTVRRQLEMIRRRFDGDNPVRVAERLGIDKLLDNRPFELSTGELRRAEIAAALVRRPTCLLADEPFRGIAPKDAEDVARVLREFAATGAAVVVTGHEVSVLLDAADHVTWCTSGTTLELGPPATATQHHAFRREYLGAWYRSTAV
jgi:ABC-type multidrug transport system ATPase subunit